MLGGDAMETLLMTTGILLIQLVTAIINLKTARINSEKRNTLTRQRKSKSPNRSYRL